VQQGVNARLEQFTFGTEFSSQQYGAAMEIERVAASAGRPDTPDE